MKLKKTLTTAATIFITSFANADIIDNTRQLNQHSQELLGIDLVAFTYLMEVSVGSTITYDQYYNDGAYKYYEQLEAAGYLRLEIDEERPGKSLEKRQIYLYPSIKAYEVQMLLK